MKTKIKQLAAILMLILTMSACGDNIEDEPNYIEDEPDYPSVSKTLWERHNGSRLKILAIGNSFTINAATYLPWMIDNFNDDSICIARLTRSSCSLDMHWNSHLGNTPDYDLFYSDGGDWVCSDIKTLDEALGIFDWDIIVLQQESGRSGLYSTYQPYLDNLAGLFMETQPEAKLAWHYTWAYTPWTQHPGFKNYDYDSEKMYEAIMSAGDKASKDFDIRIYSATLIKRMREAFPEVENGFSEDGYHIVDDTALYALSSLWYEMLIRPTTNVSCLHSSTLPASVDPKEMKTVDDIITSIMEDNKDVD